MRYGPAILALIAMTGGCTSPAERDLEAVKSARSVLAEWALVEVQAARGDTPATYADQMRSAAGDQLATARKTLNERHADVAALLPAPGTKSTDSAGLRRVRDALAPIETALEHS